MDILNAVFTFGPVAIALYAFGVKPFIKRHGGTFRSSQPTQAQIDTTALAQATPETPLPLATVLAHLNDKCDDVPHFFGVGGTGAGKSTFARIVLAPRIARGEQFIILTGKRSSVFEDLPCIGRDPIGKDGEITFNAARETFRALSRELARRDNTPIRQRAFTTLNILIDDATILLAELPEAAKFLRDAALLGRELDMRLIVQLGSLRVKELGWEGRGDLREHFAVVTYEKNLDGTRTTLLRPRFDDKNDIPFDASQVPHIAPKLPIDASRAWREPRDRDAELMDMLGLEPGRQAGRQAGNLEIPQKAPPARCLPVFDGLEGTDLKLEAIRVLLEGGATQPQVKSLLRGDTTETSKLIRQVLDSETVFTA